MRKKRVIVVAVGEKGVSYRASSGNGNSMKPLLELVATSKADSWTLTVDGAIAYFRQSPRVAQLLESFFSRAEALRESMPLLGVGVAHEYLVGQLDWLGRLKPDFHVDTQTEQRALAGIRGAQTNRSILDEIV